VTVQQLWNRVLAVALAGLPLCAVIWTVAAWLYDAHSLLSAEITQTRLRLHAYESMLERRPEIEAALARSRHSGRNYYWAGPAEGGAAEELQRQLLSVIDAAGGSVQDVQTLPATRDGAYTAVNLRVVLDASATELLETLYSIESNRPYLFLNQVHVRALGRPPHTAQEQETALQASLDVRGYLEP
jgi:general secretion pathway protein M